MAEIKQENITDIQLKTQTQKPQTRLEALRALLKDLENRIARLSELTRQAALEIPGLFDDVDDLIKELQERGSNLSSELGQLKTLSAQFTNVRVDFIRKIGGPQVLAEARRQVEPREDHWWWYADLSLAEENKRKTMRLLRIFGVAIVLLVVAGLVYNQFLAPDPAFRASYGHQQEAENALMEGNLQTAVAEVQNALTYTPEEASLYVLQGVIQEALGEAGEAETSYETARLLYERADTFYNQRTILYIMLGEPQRALEDTQSAIEINPKSAITYLHQGQAYENLGQIKNAIQSYEKADELAQQSNNVQLQAIIRINLSNAYQRISLPTFELEEPLATDTP
jgi:tetratricopeptide (TPR) repeat protein